MEPVLVAGSFFTCYSVSKKEKKQKGIMINTVVFDIGMVLVYFRWKELFADLGFAGEKFNKIAKATVQNPWWNEFDKGLMSVEEVVDKYAEMATEYKEEIAGIYEHSHEFVELYDYAIPWIHELKERGYKVYVLSNWSEPAYEANKDTHLRFLKEMDGGIRSKKFINCFVNDIRLILKKQYFWMTTKQI